MTRNSPAAEPLRIRHRVIRAGGWALAGFAVEKLVAFLQLVVLTRLLVPGDFGLMAASAAVLLALQMFSELGLEPAVIAKPALDEADLHVAWTLSVLRAAVLALGLWACADMIARGLQMPELADFLRVHTIGILIQSFQSPALVVLLRKLDLRRRVFFDLSRRAIEAGATIGLAWWLQNAWALLGGQVVAFMAGTALSFWIAPCRLQWSLHRTSLRNLWNYGRYQHVTAWFLFTVMSGGDFIIGRLYGVGALGVFQIAMAIPTMIGIRAMGVITQISLPTYALLQQDREGAIRALSLQMSLTGMIVIPIALGTAILAPYLVPFLFGPAWAEAIDPLRVLCLFAVAAAFCSVMAALHCGAGQPRLQTKIWFVMCCVYLATAIPFTMTWGLVGAAWALSLTFLIGLLFHVQATVQLLGSETWAAFGPLRWAGILVGMIAVSVGASQAAPSLWIAQWLAGISGTIGMSLYAWHLWAREYPRLRGLWGM